MSGNNGQAANGAQVLTTKAGTNIGGAGEHNRRVVMHGLRVNGAMSRAQIARGTGLVPQTVSNIIDELTREGLVVAAEPVKGARGQPATPYSLAAQGAVSYGMQIDQHRVRAVAVDLLGRIVASADSALRPIGLQANLELILATLSRVTSTLEMQVSVGRPRVLGLGLAMPAPTGVHAVRDDPWMVGLSDAHPMAQTLQRETGLTVSLHHDASAAAVAERLTGSAVGIDNFALIFISYGLGAALYTHGEPYRGHHRLAGELGQVMVQGQYGPVPLEQLCALSGLYTALGIEPNRPDLFDQLERAVRVCDPAVDQWLASAAPHLVWAIDLIECVIDPECVLIGGQMPGALMTRLMEAIRLAQAAMAVIFASGCG